MREQHVQSAGPQPTKHVEISLWCAYLIGLVCVLWNAVADPEWWRWVLVVAWAYGNLSLLISWRRRRRDSSAGLA